jgi:chromosome segregation ATPase
MDGAILTALISAAVAIGGTIAAFLSRNKDSTDKRLDLLFTANKDLVEDLRTERTELRTERTELRARLDVLESEVEGLQVKVHQQDNELANLRARELELRAWADDIMRWAATAVTLIRGMGGTIDNPPTPPRQPIDP